MPAGPYGHSDVWSHLRAEYASEDWFIDDVQELCVPRRCHWRGCECRQRMEDRERLPEWHGLSGTSVKHSANVTSLRSKGEPWRPCPYPSPCNLTNKGQTQRQPTLSQSPKRTKLSVLCNAPDLTFHKLSGIFVPNLRTKEKKSQSVIVITEK